MPGNRPLESLQLFGRPGTALGVGQLELVGMHVITRSASGLDLASDPAGELSTMPPVPNESCCSYRRSGNSTRRKWSREMNKEVMFCYYHVLLSSGVSAFRKPMHRLWCKRNPSLADVSEQRLADQKRFLLASGKLTESELEEIKREAAQDGKPGSDLSSAMAADYSSVQTSAMDELLIDDSAAMTLVGDSVTPRMTAAEMAPGARGRKPVVSDHDAADYSGSGLVVQPVVVLSGDRSFTRDSCDILSVNDTSDVVRCSAVNGSLPPCNSVERVEYLGNGSIVRPVSVLSGDCSSTRDSGDILSVDDTSDVVQCSDGNGLPPPCNFVRSVEHLRSGSVVLFSREIVRLQEIVVISYP